jgi:hypothetical protein
MVSTMFAGEGVGKAFLVGSLGRRFDMSRSVGTPAAVEFALGRASDVVSGSMIDHAIHGFYRHNRNNSHTFDIYLLPIREVAVTSRPYRGFGPKLEGCRITSDLMDKVFRVTGDG